MDWAEKEYFILGGFLVGGACHNFRFHALGGVGVSGAGVWSCSEHAIFLLLVFYNRAWIGRV